MAIGLDDITVILPARNQSRKTTRFLKSPPENIELILIEASEDSTHDIVKSTGPHYTTVIRRRGAVTEARSLGVETATTPWPLFTDVGVEFSEGYFKKLADRKPRPDSRTEALARSLYDLLQRVCVR
ncbi:MAG: hypothetical protein RIG61_08720 [Deltaproteobacteria bacterium]